jgi:hypothetical protein
MKPGEFEPTLPFIFQVCLWLYLNHNILKSHKKICSVKFSAWFPNQKRGSNKLGPISEKHLRFWMFIWSNLDSWPFEVPPPPIKKAYNEFTVQESSAAVSEWIKIPLVKRKVVSEHIQWNQALSRSIDTLLSGKCANQSMF